mmetsp:Transcript_17263/g.41224  ORF Transcript_17263/g.41224 Transcript_17263/m.41224 type:complete len:706 (-) Transcript_17263:2697-4814(-)
MRLRALGTPASMSCFLRSLSIDKMFTVQATTSRSLGLLLLLSSLAITAAPPWAATSRRPFGAAARLAIPHAASSLPNESDPPRICKRTAVAPDWMSLSRTSGRAARSQTRPAAALAACAEPCLKSTMSDETPPAAATESLEKSSLWHRFHSACAASSATLGSSSRSRRTIESTPPITWDDRSAALPSGQATSKRSARASSIRPSAVHRQHPRTSAGTVPAVVATKVRWRRDEQSSASSRAAFSAGSWASASMPWPRRCRLRTETAEGTAPASTMVSRFTSTAARLPRAARAASSTAGPRRAVTAATSVAGPSTVAATDCEAAEWATRLRIAPQAAAAASGADRRRHWRISWSTSSSPPRPTMASRPESSDARLDMAPAAAAAAGSSLSPSAKTATSALVTDRSLPMDLASSRSLDMFHRQRAAASRRAEPSPESARLLSESRALTRRDTAPDTAAREIASLLPRVRQARERAARALCFRTVSAGAPAATSWLGSARSASSPETTASIFDLPPVRRWSTQRAECCVFWFPFSWAQIRPSTIPLLRSSLRGTCPSPSVSAALRVSQRTYAATSCPWGFPYAMSSARPASKPQLLQTRLRRAHLSSRARSAISAAWRSPGVASSAPRACLLRISSPPASISSCRCGVKSAEMKGKSARTAVSRALLAPCLTQWSSALGAPSEAAAASSRGDEPATFRMVRAECSAARA